MGKSSILRGIAEMFVKRKREYANLIGLLDHFSNVQNLIKIPPSCSFAGQGSGKFCRKKTQNISSQQYPWDAEKLLAK